MEPDTTGDLGSILGIWGHPDDEAWLSSGLMMRAVEAGHRVMCVTATRGEAGFPADDARSTAERSAVREAELAACLEILGVTEHRYLGYGDGKCADVPDREAVSTLVEIIDDMRPDTILSFGPDGATGHPDHIATCRWTTRAVEEADLPNTRLLYSTKTARWTEEFFAGVDPSTIYMIEDFVPEHFDESEVEVWFSCGDELADRKVAAMLAQASQIEPLAHSIGLDVFREVIREEFFRAPRTTDAEMIEQMSHVRIA
jgi:LmbE family N-acetylglucosaminyl deacetylase